MRQVWRGYSGNLGKILASEKRLAEETIMERKGDDTGVRQILKGDKMILGKGWYWRRKEMI